MANKPKTNIIIKVTDMAMTTDVWKLFDHIVQEMEKPVKGADGLVNPTVDAMGRKLFRAEFMKALKNDADVMAVFNRWVTVLVPEFVPIQSRLHQAALAVGQAAAVEMEHKALLEKERKREARKERLRRNLEKARAAKAQKAGAGEKETGNG